MALPTTPPLAEVLRDARQRWGQTKRVASRIHTMSAEGDIAARHVLGLADNLRQDLAYFQGVAATPGIGEYAQAQYGDGYDIGPDFTAFTTEIENTIAWIVGAIPKDPDGYLLVQTLTAAGERVDRTFTPAETQGLRDVLDALIATIE